MRNLLFFLVLFLFPEIMPAQLSFLRTYGPGVGQRVQTTADSGFVISGVKDSASVRYPFLMKTNITGEVEWTIQFSPLAALTNLLVFPNGYFVAITNSNNNSTDLVWTNLTGYITHSTTISGQVRACNITGDGMIVCTGKYNNDLMACRFDMQGTMAWSHYWDFGNQWIEIGYSIFEAENGNLIIGADFVSPFADHMFNFVKLSANGIVVHDVGVSSTASFCIYAPMGGIRVGNDYVFYGAGYNSSPGPHNTLVIKTDSLFNVISETLIIDTVTTIANYSILTANGEIALLRWTRTATAGVGLHGVVTLDQSLNIIAEHTGAWPVVNNYQVPESQLTQTFDGGLAYTGTCRPDSSGPRLIALTKLEATQPGCGASPTISGTTPLINAARYTYANPASSGSLTSQVNNISTYYFQMNDSILCMYNPGALGFSDHPSNTFLSLQTTLVTDNITVLPSGQALHWEYRIFNSIGMEVSAGKFDDQQQINVGHLAQGVYILYIEKEGPLKFVKQ